MRTQADKLAQRAAGKCEASVRRGTHYWAAIGYCSRRSTMIDRMTGVHYCTQHSEALGIDPAPLKPVA